MSPTERTLAACRSYGWVAEVVEKVIRIPQRKPKPGQKPGPPIRRVDLFGFADIIVLDDDPGVLLIQACSGGDVAIRRAKVCAEPRARRCLERGNRIQVWGWRKYTRPDETGRIWRPYISEVCLP